MKNLLTTKTAVILFFACIFCWVAAASIERSMRLSGQSKEQGTGALRAKLHEEIEKQRSEIAALPESKSALDRLTLASKLEELGSLLWQDQKMQEASEVLTRALSLERQGGASKERIISTLNLIATVCRDSNNYFDMRTALRQIQTLNEHDPSTPIEVLIRDRQNMASCNFLFALAEKDPAKRREQLVLTQTMMHDLKKELLNDRPIETLSPSEKYLLATIDENQASIFDELGDASASKTLKDEAQTLRSANR